MISNIEETITRRFITIPLGFRSTTNPMAIPETMADSIKINGIKGVDHQGLATTEPKIKPV
ncbi:hypothetical protein AUJ95_04450 [Candidatus Desantisbacteria bacterium CG2_30_40_21]|uniref:Uncharacterized protein n=1 Tax=Candidatus Desantisbacteria bacterium CG2_30_40_21 TaxID=1817895 RepID=A0A1J5ED04_9BACT|nr:MAG: hypothetical protein AUJ95_04450 [Candidatus Desantisbacteria bacterium CG2_30_40_21]